jgi:hypothetical protein
MLQTHTDHYVAVPRWHALALVVPPPTDQCAVHAQAASVPSAHSNLPKSPCRGLAGAARIVPPTHDLIVKSHGAGVIPSAGAQLRESALGRASPVASKSAPPAGNAAVVAQATTESVACADLAEKPGRRRAFPKLVAAPAGDRVVGQQAAGMSLTSADLKNPHSRSCVGRRAQRRVGRRLGVRFGRRPSTGRGRSAATCLAKHKPEQHQRYAAGRQAHRSRLARILGTRPSGLR